MRIPRNFFIRSTLHSQRPTRLSFDQISDALQSNEDLLLSSTEDPDSFATAMNNVFDSCTQPIIRKKPKKCPWFSSYLADLRSHMLSLPQKCKITHHPRFFELYSIARRAYHSQINIAKQAYKQYQIKCLIEEAKQLGIRALYKAAKPPSNPSSVNIDSFLNHCKALFSSLISPSFIPITSCDEKSHPLLAPFSSDEVSSMLSHTKSKAVSQSNLSPFLLRRFRNVLSTPLASFFSQCLNKSYFPVQWLESILFFIHKKGDSKDPNNYRSIAIQNPFLKVFSSLLNNRILKYVNSLGILPVFQFGF